MVYGASEASSTVGLAARSHGERCDDGEVRNSSRQTVRAKSDAQRRSYDGTNEVLVF